MNETTFALGSWKIDVPEGWTFQISPDRAILKPSPQQEATISLMRFDEDITFEHFKKLSDIHLRAARKLVPDGFVDPETPMEDRGAFWMFFFGGDKSEGRMFFGCQAARRNELIFVLFEGVGIDVQAHVNDCQKLWDSLKRN